MNSYTITRPANFLVNIIGDFWFRRARFGIPFAGSNLHFQRSFCTKTDSISMAAGADAAYIVASDSEITGDDTTDRPGSLVDTVIGIDFGTANCRTAVWNNGAVELISNAYGIKQFPSYVLFKGETPTTGINSSRSTQELWLGNAIFNIKSIIGRMDVDPKIKNAKYPFLLESLGIGVRPFLGALGNDVWRSTTPEEVLAIQLVEIRAMAEAYLGRMVRTAVLTIPVSFSRFQQTRVERACGMAGLSVMRMMPEPSAVALVYAQQQQQMTQGNMGSGSEKLALILNMGAGYCDVALTATAGGVSQIRAVTGDVLGGDDLVQNVMNYLEADFSPYLHNSLHLRPSPLTGALRSSTEKAMHTLSSQTSAVVEVLINEQTGEKFSRTITRDVFEEINKSVFERCKDLVVQCLTDAEVEPDYISDVIAVGGCSNVPKIRAILQNIFENKELYKDINVFEGAVRGAALEGAITSGVDNLELLTIQAMPLGLGIKLAGGDFFTILNRNSTIPARRDVIVTTSHDNQTDALIIVYEGQGKRAAENHLLGFFKLSGIPPAPKGVPLISICMDVDASNVLRVVGGVAMPNSPIPAVLLREVRMPTVDDGHGWCIEAIAKEHGSKMDVVLPGNAETGSAS